MANASSNSKAKSVVSEREASFSGVNIITVIILKIRRKLFHEDLLNNPLPKMAVFLQYISSKAFKTEFLITIVILVQLEL